MNPTKLGLHFSDFSTVFYEFSKIQPNCFTIEVSTLHRGPWIFLQIHNHALRSHKTPWKERGRCNVVLGMEGGAARRNWAAPAAPLAGEEVGEDDGLTSNRFVAEDGRRSAGSWPVGSAQGARLGRALLRRTPDLGRGKDGTGRL
jgi:hypothetical protein